MCDCGLMDECGAASIITGRHAIPRERVIEKMASAANVAEMQSEAPAGVDDRKTA